MTVTMDKAKVESTSETELRLSGVVEKIVRQADKLTPRIGGRRMLVDRRWAEMITPGGLSLCLVGLDGLPERVPVDFVAGRDAMVSVVGNASDIDATLRESYPALEELLRLRELSGWTPLLAKTFDELFQARESLSALNAIVSVFRAELTGRFAPGGLAGKLASLKEAAGWLKSYPEGLPQKHRTALEALADTMAAEAAALEKALLTETWSLLERLAAKLK